VPTAGGGTDGKKKRFLAHGGNSGRLREGMRPPTREGGGGRDTGAPWMMRTLRARWKKRKELPIEETQRPDPLLQGESRLHLGGRLQEARRKKKKVNPPKKGAFCSVPKKEGRPSAIGKAGGGEKNAPRIHGKKECPLPREKKRKENEQSSPPCRKEIKEKGEKKIINYN